MTNVIGGKSGFIYRLKDLKDNINVHIAKDLNIMGY